MGACRLLDLSSTKETLECSAKSTGSSGFTYLSRILFIK